MLATSKSPYANIYILFLSYFLIFLFISFISNPMTNYMGDPFSFFQMFGTGDSIKFINFADRSLQQGFACPRSHCPGLQFIDIILLWVNPKFPIILFLAILNSLLWSVLFTQLYSMGRQRINSYFAFFIPLMLLMVYFSLPNFLRGEGILLGTSFTSVSLCIGIIFILFSIQNNNILLSVLSGGFFAFSAYMWSMSDHMITYLSIGYAIYLFLFFSLMLILKRKNFATYIRFTQFPVLKSLGASFLTFGLFTLPYRLYVKSITMVPTGENWQKIWQLPTYWIDGTYDANSTFQMMMRNGGFPFCRAYPEVCQELHKNPELHNNMSYLKNLAIQVFVNNPLTLIEWKLPFLIRLWNDGHETQNGIILSLFVFIIVLFFTKPNKYNITILFFCSGVFVLTLGMLFLCHIEPRYFYISKFVFCVGFLLSVYALIPTKNEG